MKMTYNILAVLLATLALSVTLGSCHLIGPAISIARLFDTTASISTWRGNTVRDGALNITVGDARIDDRAYLATGGLVVRWLVLNVTVTDTCNNVLVAGVQRFPLMPHECPVPVLLVPGIDTGDGEPSGGLDR